MGDSMLCGIELLEEQLCRVGVPCGTNTNGECLQSEPGSTPDVASTSSREWNRDGTAASGANSWKTVAARVAMQLSANPARDARPSSNNDVDDEAEEGEVICSALCRD